VAWFSHLLDAYDPGRLGRAVDVRTTALDHASRKAVPRMSDPTHPTPSQPPQQPPGWQPPPPEWAQATNPTPTPPPWGAGATNPTLPPAPPGRRRRRWILAAVGVGLVLAIAAAGVTSGTDQPASKASSVQPPATAAPAPSTTEPAPEPVEPTYDVPKVDDFEFEVKETSREHFGSAGDLVEYKLELAVDKSKSFDPDVTYDLKYRISGDEDGPNTNTITVQGDTYEVPSEDMASTLTNGKVTVKILSITEA
jgi:hypothetical protein